MFSQDILGPLLQVELTDSGDRLPGGIRISLRHFLTIPNSELIRKEVEREGYGHSIVKMTKEGGKWTVEKIDSVGAITSQFLSTSKFEKKRLCLITTSLLGSERYECRHSSLKKIIVTKDRVVKRANVFRHI